ncbi:hypothetical protein AMK22_08340 [Streptomyces sp. CB01580]|nr:hypothetical protein AMK22_08340 [Streptomyces sp. CB01580]
MPPSGAVPATRRTARRRVARGCPASARKIFVRVTAAPHGTSMSSTPGQETLRDDPSHDARPDGARRLHDAPLHGISLHLAPSHDAGARRR